MKHRDSYEVVHLLSVLQQMRAVCGMVILIKCFWHCRCAFRVG